MNLYVCFILFLLLLIKPIMGNCHPSPIGKKAEMLFWKLQTRNVWKPILWTCIFNSKRKIIQVYACFLCSCNGFEKRQHSAMYVNPAARSTISSFMKKAKGRLEPSKTIFLPSKIHFYLLTVIWDFFFPNLNFFLIIYKWSRFLSHI